ncbi:hypothetical protein BJ878DRAFT_528042 [Calycina marina]|uniref:Peroxisomal membrane protein PEX17 n=1 Tax=Calycina marina TaxID=1763456 RepID=A0A9P7YUB0_9HELO|nr:hypothetical protein BJ878DRAFT_528042 [Calycina marina]
MPADRLLTTVLGAFQGSPADSDQINRILSTTTSLLTTLSNPLNISLLTSQLLTAPAIWGQTGELAISFRIISIFNTAAITVRKNQLEGPRKPYDAYQPRHGGGIHCDDWARAVVKGADDKSARWEHVLVIAGVLLGMEGQNRRGLSQGLRTTLEDAMVTATNLAVKDPSCGKLGLESVVLAINHTFPLLSGAVSNDLDYDTLLMVMGHAMTSSEGFHDGLVIEAIGLDVIQVAASKFDWSAQSPSFLLLKNMSSKPLVTSMGPLSRLIAHAVEHSKDPRRLLELREHLLAFTTKIFASWQRSKLSEIDSSEETLYLTTETVQVTLPVLWQVLKSSMFASIVVLQAIIGKFLIDPMLARSQGTETAAHALLMLRNLHFISSRLGPNSFTAYTFVNLTSIDILSRSPAESCNFLKSIYPQTAGQIPAHPLKRNLDLFYLNNSEHFTLVLSPADNELLIVTPASPYLNPTADARLREIFEAAHSAMLAALAAPQAAELNAKILPFYVESLFNSFPTNLSPRQFQFAFKTLIQITTPPAPLSVGQPDLAETLLELLHHRALHAPTIPIPPRVVENDAAAQNLQPPLSEQAVLLLTLLDALPNLPIILLKDWLSLTVDLLNAIDNEAMKQVCRARLWKVLESGDMDVERSAICVEWWSTRGGREKVLFGDVEEPYLMSGGLGERDTSRL